MTEKIAVNTRLDQTLERRAEFTRERLSAARWNHTVHVLNRTEELLQLHPNLECRRTSLLSAALFHDLAKDLSSGKQLELAERFREGLDEITRAIPALWHGPASARLVTQNFDCSARSPVPVAVNFHSTGNPEPDKLTDLLLVADFSSSDREFEAAEKIRNITGDQKLGRLAQLVVKHKISGCLQDDRMVHPDSLKTYNRLCH